MKTIRKAIALIMSAAIAAAVLSGCSGAKIKTEDLKKTATDSFSSIRLNVDAAKVDVIPEADTYAIEYHIANQTVDYSVKDGVLTLKATGDKKVNINYTEQSYIKIYVPESSEFAGIDCESNVGDVRIGKIKADDITVISDVGNVILSDITVQKNLNVKTAVGNIEVDLANTDCSYNISADVAQIVINGESFSGIEVKKSYASANGPQVTISTATGSIRFDSKSL